MPEDLLQQDSDEEVELGDLMEEFDPEGDEIDAILTYLLTGKELGRAGAMKDWLGRP